jgi:hypothetical protein
MNMGMPDQLQLSAEGKAVEARVAERVWLSPDHFVLPDPAAEPTAVPVAAGPTPGYAWARFTQRLQALVIDAVILAAGIGPVLLLARVFGSGTIGTVAVTSTWLATIGFLYWPLSWWILRGTPGQRIRGLLVLRADDGLRLPLSNSIRRHFVLVVVVFALVVVHYGFHWAERWARQMSGRMNGASDPCLRTLWDRTSGAVVIKRV